MRTFGLIGALLLGAMLPQLHVFGPVIRPLLIAMLFVTFLKLDFRQLAPRGVHWVIVGLNWAIPVGVWLALAWAGHPDLAIAAFFIAVSPTATNAPVVLGFLGRNVEFGVTSLVLTNVGACLAIPLILPLVSDHPAPGLAGDLAWSMAVVLGVPGILALLARRVYPRVREWPGKLANWQFAAWNLALVVIAARGSHYIMENAVSPWTLTVLAVLALALCLAQFGAGALIGSLVRPGLAQEASQSLGQKNTILTIYVAMAHDFPLAALALTFYVLCHNTWNVIQLHQDARKKKLSRREVEKEEAAIFGDES